MYLLDIIKIVACLSIILSNKTNAQTPIETTTEIDNTTESNDLCQAGCEPCEGPEIVCNNLNLTNLGLFSEPMESSINITITGNHIKVINDTIFYYNLTNLEYLNLSNNSIKYLSGSNIFDNIPNLKELVLENNNLESLDFNISSLNDLSLVNLKSNKIARVNKDFIDEIKKMRSKNKKLSVLLADNPFICDCFIIHLHDLIISDAAIIQDYDQLTCSHQDSLVRFKNKKIMDLKFDNENDFHNCKNKPTTTTRRPYPYTHNRTSKTTKSNFFPFVTRNPKQTHSLKSLLIFMLCSIIIGCTILLIMKIHCKLLKSSSRFYRALAGGSNNGNGGQFNDNTVDGANVPINSSYTVEDLNEIEILEERPSGTKRFLNNLKSSFKLKKIQLKRKLNQRSSLVIREYNPYSDTTQPYDRFDVNKDDSKKQFKMRRLSEESTASIEPNILNKNNELKIKVRQSDEKNEPNNERMHSDDEIEIGYNNGKSSKYKTLKKVLANSYMPVHIP